jgi:hypothetical protein
LILTTDGKLDLSKIEDPYLKYGGAYYKNDPKNASDFKYVEFTSLPKV